MLDTLLSDGEIVPLHLILPPVSRSTPYGRMCDTPPMTDGPTQQELSERMVRLEERMDTRKAETETGLERLSKELAQRDRAMLISILGMIALAVAVLKFA